MQRIRFNKIAALVASISFLFFAASPCVAQEKGKPQQAAPQKAASSTVKEHGGPQEGIKVHGHWVIEVLNPNGTLADRREFDNSLLPGGKFLLTLLLSRTNSMGHWWVGLNNNTNSGGYPCGGVAANKACGIYEGTPKNPYTDTETAGVSLIAAASDDVQQLLLKGTGTATGTGRITQVAAFVFPCPKDVAPSASCQIDGGNSDVFSSAVLPSPVNVVPEQIIQVTVTYTFS